MTSSVTLHSEANKRVARAGAAFESAQSRLDRAQLVLRELESPERGTLTSLEATQKNLSGELQALVIQHNAFKDSAPDMVTVSSRFERARSALDNGPRAKGAPSPEAARTRRNHQRKGRRCR